MRKEDLLSQIMGIDHQPLVWQESGRYEKAQAGHLFCYIECIDYEEDDHYEWFIAPDDEDKNDRRAIAGSDYARLPSREAAIAAVEAALRDISCEIMRFT